LLLYLTTTAVASVPFHGREREGNYLNNVRNVYSTIIIIIIIFGEKSEYRTKVEENGYPRLCYEKKVKKRKFLMRNFE